MLELQLGPRPDHCAYHQQPAKVTIDQLSAMARLIEAWRLERPLLVTQANNAAQDIIDYVLSEVDEVKEAWDQHQQSEKIVQWQDLHILLLEIVDVLVLLDALRLGQGISRGIYEDLDLVEKQPSHLNLTDLHPLILLQVLEEQIKELGIRLEQMNVVEEQLKIVLGIWISLLNKIPGQMQIIFFTRLKLRINSANRPREFYQTDNGGARPLSSAEQLQKVAHVEACLRLIRDYFAQELGEKSPLRPWMYELFQDWILNYGDSKESLLALRAALQSGDWRATLVQRLNSYLKEPEVAVNGNADNGFQLHTANLDFMLQLKLAGAVPV